MTPEQFRLDALRTESRLPCLTLDGDLCRVLHAAMGLVTEAAEIMDALKKHIFYGKKLDLVNLLEEAGDNDWYLAILLDGLGFSREKSWETVIAKLKARYPERFSSENALNRDLTQERSVLESNYGERELNDRS